MASLELLMHPLGQCLTLALAHFLWQGAAISVLAYGLVVLLRLKSAPARYALFCGAMLLMAVCPPATFSLLMSNRVPRPMATTIDHAPIASSLALAEYDEAMFAADPGAVLPGAAANETIADATIGWLAALQPWLLAGWLAGVCCLGLRLSLSLGGVVWLRRDRRPLDERWRGRAAELARRLGIRGAVGVFATDRVREAVAAGFFRPVVLLPAAWLAEMPPQVLEAVIAHELAHIRRLDVWVNLVQRLLETMLFYHPAVWLLSRRIRLEREMCCDALAAEAIGRRDVYVDALEKIAARRIRVPQAVLSTAIRGGNSMNLLKRVRYLLHSSVPPAASIDRRGMWWPAGLIALAGPAALLAVAVALPGAGNGQEERDVERERETRRRVERDGDLDRDGDRETDGNLDPNRDRERRTVKTRRESRVRRDGDRERGESDARREGDREHRNPLIRRDGDRDRDEDGFRQQRDQDIIQRNAIDEFIERRWREMGIEPAEESEKRMDRIRQYFEQVREPRQRERNRDDQLLEVIIELKNEIAELRQELREMRGMREEATIRSRARERDEERYESIESDWPVPYRVRRRREVEREPDRRERDERSDRERTRDRETEQNTPAERESPLRRDRDDREEDAGDRRDESSEASDRQRDDDRRPRKRDDAIEHESDESALRDAPPRLDGTVTSLADDLQLIEISLGADDGLRIRTPLHVYRGNRYLGRIEIIRVGDDEAVGRILQSSGELLRGDRVATHLDGKRLDAPPVDDGAASITIDSAKAVGR